MRFFVAAFALILAAAAVLFALARLGRRPAAVPLLALLYGASFGLSESGWLADGLLEYLVRSAAVLLAAALLGWLIGLTMPNLETLVVTTLVAAVIDVWSFFGGTTRSLLEHGSPVLPYLLLAVPWHGGVRMVIGLGDLVFLAASFHLLPPPGRPAFLAAFPLLGLELALAVGLQTGGVPAIPFLAAGLAAAWWLDRRMAGRERSARNPLNMALRRR